MIQPKTLTFLRQLKKNNEKTWFDQHKEQYLAAKTDFEVLVARLIEGLGKTDPELGALRLKDCVFRIYKDVRFSHDKTPYKVHFAAGFIRGGKKVHYPGYYFHLEPGGNSYCGGGIWRPEAPELKKIRQEIDYNYEEFRSIVRGRKFLRLFGPLEDEDALVRPPQGYHEDNPAIEVLKFRNYIAGTGIDDALLTSPRLAGKILEIFATLSPLIDFLGRAGD
jgi:uncharacterized protein (TIGR02453 family)